VKEAFIAAPLQIPQVESCLPVLLPQAVDRPFTYLSHEPLPAGTLVKATLSGKSVVACVWDGAPEIIPSAKLKPIGSSLPGYAPLDAPYRQWIDWVSDFTLAPKGAVLGMAGLAFAGKSVKKPYLTAEYKIDLPELTAGQRNAWRITHDAMHTANPKPLLLDGVTGSGKTEVYFHLISELLHASPSTRHAPQTLVLLPEIALTHQWLERFESAFGAKPVVWHSGQTPAARAKAWQAIVKGDAHVVVGARSALFLPFNNLKLIVVDEEHDPSYKQEDGVLYHARDMAVARAKFQRIPIILSSATPSLETLHNVAQGRYDSVTLPERFGSAGLPNVTILDLLQTPPERGEFLSPPVKAKLLETLAKGEQSLLFLNRRGYAPLLLCRGCGHRFECPDCSAWLVVHRAGIRNQVSGIRNEASDLIPDSRSPIPALHCHHCDHREPLPPHCPKCEAPQEKLAPCGPGVERIADEVNAMFKTDVDAPSRTTHHAPRVTLLSSDESIAAETWSAIERGEIDILIGTQMAAKGHHFPKLTFVAVIDADLGLDGADLRAAERTYQLLHQLAGRAGREARTGEVLVQTYQPKHPVMQALKIHDRGQIMNLELAARQRGHWPPFGQLAAILLDGKDDASVRRAAQSLAQSAPQDKRLTVLGPAPAPLSKLRGQYRYRLLIKAEKSIQLQRTLRAWLTGKKFSGVRIKIDVNPYYFL
jgi:primosomal protein N' (replication factor Y)